MYINKDPSMLISLGHLGTHLGLSTAAMTYRVKRLQGLGLIAVVPDEIDRRIKRISVRDANALIKFFDRSHKYEEL